MNAITINDKNRTIEMNKTVAKAAAIFGTPEYEDLQKARRDYPNFRVITVKQKGGKADFQFLSFKYMDKYLASHDESGEQTAVYRSLRGLDGNGVAEDFQTIKAWFLNTFPEFEEFRAERKALLAKIESDKKARLAARKKAA